jgi:hypothetical protein
MTVIVEAIKKEGDHAIREMARTEALAVSVEEAARRVGISRALLYQKLPEIGFIKINGRTVVLVESLRRWLARLAAEQGAE